VLGAGVAVVPLSFVVLTVITTVYAFALAFQARGAPDQAAISHFAARISPRLMPWLEMFLTLLVAMGVARKAAAPWVDGLFVGILAAGLNVMLDLAFGARLGLHQLVFTTLIAGLGCLGGLLGQNWLRTRSAATRGVELRSMRDPDEHQVAESMKQVTAVPGSGRRSDSTPAHPAMTDSSPRLEHFGGESVGGRR
jgi:hypothetical protein